MSATPIYDDRQRQKDNDQLNLLSIFHFVVAGLTLFGMGFLIVHYLIMSTVFTNPEMWKNEKNPPPPEFFEMFSKVFILLYGFLGLVLVILFVLNVLSGLFLRQRKNRFFSLVVGGVNCLQIPFGTVLGIFTILILTRDSVREAYAMGGKPGATG